MFDAMTPMQEANSTMSKRRSTRRQPLTLLTMPAEVRIKMYQAVLVHDDDVALTPGMLRWNFDTPMVQLVGDFLALSLTNRQLRNETEDIFFRKNCFRFWSFGPFPRISERYVNLMEHVRLYKCIPVTVCAFQVYRKQGVVHLSVEIVPDGQKSNEDSDWLHDLSLGAGVISQLQKSTDASAEILRRSLDDGRGIAMKDLQAVANQLNCDWWSLRRQ